MKYLSSWLDSILTNMALKPFQVRVVGNDIEIAL